MNRKSLRSIAKVFLLALAVLLPALPALGADPTLATVKKRGELLCGVNGSLPAFSYLDDSKERRGFDADYCRAIAAAEIARRLTRGDPDQARFHRRTRRRRTARRESGRD